MIQMMILQQVIGLTDRKTYPLPGNEIVPICVKQMNDSLIMYFKTDATADEIVNKNPSTPITVCIVGTGLERDDLNGFDYLDTVTTSCGEVWHCFVKNEITCDF